MVVLKTSCSALWDQATPIINCYGMVNHSDTRVIGPVGTWFVCACLCVPVCVNVASPVLDNDCKSQINECAMCRVCALTAAH